MALLIIVTIFLFQSAVQCSESIDWDEIRQDVAHLSNCREFLCSTLFPLSTNDNSISWNQSIVVGPNEMEFYDLVRFPCHCDDQCLKYGDCCIDASEHWSKTADQKSKWKCLSVPPWGDMYMIENCPDGDTRLAAMCHRQPVDDNDYTYLMDLPVLSLETNVTYANIFCAQCHQDVARLAKWEAEIACKAPVNDTEIINNTHEILKTLSYKRGELYWYSSEFSQTDQLPVKCSLEVKQLKNVPDYVRTTNGRQCIARVDSCPLESNLSDRMKCESPYALIHLNKIKYKNLHCARCNGIEDLNCSDTIYDVDSLYRDPSLNVEVTEATSELQPPTMKTITVALPILFDFLVGEGNKVGLHGPCQCWDPVYKTCECDDRYKHGDRISTWQYSKSHSYLSTACLSISVVCLALHIIIHLSLPKLRNLPGKNLMSLCCALFGAQLLFMISAEESQVGQFCVFLAVLTHWFFLASFFWMNVLGFDICCSLCCYLLKTRRTGRIFYYYSLYAWCCPTLIVAIALVVHFTSKSSFSPNYGDHICWISNRHGLIIFFVLPVALLLLINVGLFLRTVCSIVEQTRAAKFAVTGKNLNADTQQKLKKHVIQFVVYVKLALIMGLSWIFGFVASMTQNQPIMYLFILFNGLQGLFIFLSFGCKRKTYSSMRELVNNIPLRTFSLSSTKTINSSTVDH